MIPRVTSSSKNIHQIILITLIDCPAQGLKVIHHLIKNAEYRFTISQRNVTPHNGVTSCYSSKIAEPTCGITKDLSIVAHRSQCIDQRICQKMRQMTSRSQNSIMLVNTHGRHDSSYIRPERTDQTQMLTISSVMRGQNNSVILK